ncbi:hypothetical protein INR49_020620 [Caranx melampygus]|nr:hypothetical protein INR49_020620 [Caranx melampygus]
MNGLGVSERENIWPLPVETRRPHYGITQELHLDQAANSSTSGRLHVNVKAAGFNAVFAAAAGAGRLQDLSPETAAEPYCSLCGAAAPAGTGDWITDAAISQPASIAAVVAQQLPGGIHLPDLGDLGTVLLTRPDCLIIGQLGGVDQAVVANAWHRVLASAGLPGCVDGILHRAVAQPASVTPVHPSSPCIVQLVKGRHNGILVATRPFSIIEIEVVAAKAGEVWEDNAYVERWGKRERKQRKQNKRVISVMTREASIGDEP